MLQYLVFKLKIYVEHETNEILVPHLVPKLPQPSFILHSTQTSLTQLFPHLNLSPDQILKSQLLPNAQKTDAYLSKMPRKAY